MMGNQNTDITTNEAALQDGGGEGEGQDQGEQYEAYMFQNQFFPNGEFHVVSGELEAVPNPAGVGEGGLLTSFNTRIIQYTNAKNTFAYFFPYQDAQVKQGVLYRLSPDFGDLGEGAEDEGGETPRSDLINVRFQQVTPADEF